jgi:hypothetical protein
MSNIDPRAPSPIQRQETTGPFRGISITNALFDAILPGTSIDKLAIDTALRTRPIITKPPIHNPNRRQITGAHPISQYVGYGGNGGDSPYGRHTSRPIFTGPTTFGPATEAFASPPSTIGTSFTKVSSTTTENKIPGEKKKPKMPDIPIDCPIDMVPYYRDGIVVPPPFVPGYPPPPHAPHVHWHTGSPEYGPWYSSSYYGYLPATPATPPAPPAEPRVPGVSSLKPPSETTKTESKEKKKEEKKDGKESSVKEEISDFTMVIHVCITCGKPRSSGFHRDHPLIPGQKPEKTECGKCVKDRKKKTKIHYTDEDTEAEKKKKDVKRIDNQPEKQMKPKTAVKNMPLKPASGEEKKTEDKLKVEDDKYNIRKVRRTTIIMDGGNDSSATVEQHSHGKHRQPSFESDIESTRIYVRPEREGHENSRKQRDGWDEKSSRPKSALHDIHYGYLKHHAHRDSSQAGSSISSRFFHRSIHSRADSESFAAPPHHDEDHRKYSKYSQHKSHHGRDGSLRVVSEDHSHTDAHHVEWAQCDESSEKKTNDLDSDVPNSKPRTKSPPPPSPPSPSFTPDRSALVKISKKDAKDSKTANSSAPVTTSKEPAETKDATSIPGVRYVQPRETTGPQDNKKVEKRKEAENKTSEKKETKRSPHSELESAQQKNLKHTCGRVNRARDDFEVLSNKTRSEVSITSHSSARSEKTVYPENETAVETDTDAKEASQASAWKDHTWGPPWPPKREPQDDKCARRAVSPSDSDQTQEKHSSHCRHRRRSHYRSSHRYPEQSRSEFGSRYIHLPRARPLSYREYHRETSEDRATPPASAVGAKPKRRPSLSRRPPTFTIPSQDSLGPRGFRYGTEPVEHWEQVSSTTPISLYHSNIQLSGDDQRSPTNPRKEWMVHHEPSGYVSPLTSGEGSVWSRDSDELWGNTKQDYCCMTGGLAPEGTII